MMLFDDAIFILSGLGLTLSLTFGAVVFGLVLGLILAVLRYNGYMVVAISIFVSIIRGTPLLLQLSFFYFVLPVIIKIKLDVLSIGVISFGFNSSAYLAEIFRAGIESIPKGQFEAADSLQIPALYKWVDIILPQVFKNVFPALVNEVIAILKETAVISVVGGMDLMRRAQVVAASQFTYFLPLFIAGLYYYTLTVIIEYLAKKFESKQLS